MVGPDPIELLDKAAARAEADGDEPAAALARALACGRRLETLEASADDHERLVREAVPLLEDAGDNFGLYSLWESVRHPAPPTPAAATTPVEEASEQALVHAKLAGEHLTYPVMLRMSLQLGGRPVSYALRRIDTLTQTYPTPMINLFRAVLLAMNDEIKEARALAVATHDRMRELSEGTLPWAMLAEIEALAGNDEAAAASAPDPLRPPRGYRSNRSPLHLRCYVRQHLGGARPRRGSRTSRNSVTRHRRPG